MKLAGVESRFRLQEQRAGNMVSKDEWRATRLKYIRELKEPSDQQRLLFDLSDQATRTAIDERDLAAQWTAEKTAEKH